MREKDTLASLKKKLKEERRKVKLAKATFDHLKQLALDVPDGEVTPFVMQAIIAVENTAKDL